MTADVFAAVLAGGESRRFGSDKAMADLGGMPMAVRVGERLRAQSERLAVVGHDAVAEALDVVALCDDPALIARGPLRGVLAALEWAESTGARWLLTAPCDVPLLPGDLAGRLIAAAETQSARVVCARTATGLHPLCAVWSPELAATLRASLAGEHHPSAQRFADATVMFDDEGAFANINTSAEFAVALARLGSA